LTHPIGIYGAVETHGVRLRMYGEGLIFFTKTFCHTKIKLYLCSVKLIEINIARIIELCKRYRVKTLYVFGSILTTRFSDSSDVDMEVDFNEMPLEEYVENYLDLKEALEKLFGRDVDLLESKAIQNPILRNNINNSRKLVYG